MNIHEKLSLNFIGCVTLGVIALFIVVGNREVLSKTAENFSQKISASVATATIQALCYEPADIDAKKAEKQKQDEEFASIPGNIASIDNQIDKLKQVISTYTSQIAELRTELVPEDRFVALQKQIDQISKQIEDTATFKRLSNAHGDLTKQVSAVQNATEEANVNLTAVKKLLDESIAQYVDFKKIKPQVDAYQSAKDELAQVASQLADQKVLDSKALEAAQTKLSSKNNEYTKLYSAYQAKYGANAFTNSGPITYTELVTAKDHLANVFASAKVAYDTALAPFNAKYKTKANMSESDLTNSISHLQDEYNTAKANVDSMNAKLAALQKQLQANNANIESAQASIDGVAISNTTIESLRGELVDLNKNLETLDLSDGNAKADISALQIKIDAMQSSIETLVSQKADLKARYIELEESIKKLNSDIGYYSLSVCRE